MNELPEWAKSMTPVDMDGAAVLLGVSRRFLIDVLKQHRHYEQRGNRKVFYPEHVELLRESLKCQTSKSKSETVSGTPLEPLMESVYERALALATGNARKSNVRSSKRGSGNVIPMARNQSERSKKPQKVT